MRVAFLDRDGTLIYEPPNGTVRPEDFRILPGVLETLKKLRDRTYHLVMVTNQDFSREPQEWFHTTQEMLLAALKNNGIVFDALFFCPHPPQDNCNCRKPKTGMIDAFLKEHAIDTLASFVIGDRESADGGLAANIGIRYIKMEPNGQFPHFLTLDDVYA